MTLTTLVNLKVPKKQKNIDKDMKMKQVSQEKNAKHKYQMTFPPNDDLIQPHYKIQKSKDKSFKKLETKNKKKSKHEAAQPHTAEFDWHNYRAKTREHRRMQNHWETEFNQQQSNWQLDRARSREIQRNHSDDQKMFKKIPKKEYYKYRD